MIGGSDDGVTEGTGNNIICSAKGYSAPTILASKGIVNIEHFSFPEGNGISLLNINGIVASRLWVIAPLQQARI